MTDPTDLANPFDAPRADPTDSDVGRVHYGNATRGQRFANFLLDYAGVVVWSMIVGIIIAVIDPALLESEGLFDNLFGIAVMLTYYIVLEGVTGRSLGKLITGTAVVRVEDGRKPSWGRIIGRTFARFVPFEGFSFLGDDAVGWHDQWSKTRVVRLRPTKFDRMTED